MPKRVWTSPLLLMCLIVFAVLTGLAQSQDARVSLFDQYNHASTYDEIKPLVSGVLAEQYAFVASRDPQRVAQLLAEQHVSSYRPRIVEIDDATSFLVLESITSKSSRDTAARAYQVSKSALGKWTLANRLMPGSVIKTLWTTHFAPTDFVQPSSCAIDGTDIRPESVLAIRRDDSIEMTLYPFRFSQADLDYWRQVSGMAVSDEAVAASHFGDRKAAVCRLIVGIDKASRLSLRNIGFNDQKGTLRRSKLWQTPTVDVSVLALDRGRLDLVTAGRAGSDHDGIRWNLKISVPVWEQGL